MTIPRPPNWLMLAAAAACFIGLGYKVAHGENCLTNNNTGTATTVTGTAGSFFQTGGSDVVRFPNPPGIGNAQGVTVNASSNTIVNSPTGLSCGVNAKATGKQSVALGQNALASADNSVALGANAVATRPNSVSVGSPAMPNQITNVAAGTSPTDAVNVSQLTAATNNLQNQVTTLKKQTFAGISMAMAAAALQTGAGASGSGKVAIGMAGGEFAGTASLSAGLSYSPTKRLNFNAGVSYAPIVNMVGVYGGTVWTLN